MLRQSLARRLSRLESTQTSGRELRLVWQFEGPGSEGFAQPTEEEIRKNEVRVIRFVEAQDGRPINRLVAGRFEDL